MFRGRGREGDEDDCIILYIAAEEKGATKGDGLGQTFAQRGVRVLREREQSDRSLDMDSLGSDERMLWHLRYVKFQEVLKEIRFVPILSIHAAQASKFSSWYKKEIQSTVNKDPRISSGKAFTVRSIYVSRAGSTVQFRSQRLELWEENQPAVLNPTQSHS